MNISRDDRDRDKKIIINNFMRELCRKDDEANRGQMIDTDQGQNVFSVEEIWRTNLKAFALDYVKEFLREHWQESRGNEPFKFLDNEQKIRLTDAGRAGCDEYSI